MILRDYHCPVCRLTFESLEDVGTEEIDCLDCETGRAAPILSGTHAGTVWGAAARRGPNEPRPPGVLNTESLGNGQPYREWRKERRKLRTDERRKENGIESKVFVGGK